MIAKYIGSPLEIGSSGEMARGYIRALSTLCNLEIENVGRSMADYINSDAVNIVVRGMSLSLPYRVIFHHTIPTEMKIEEGKTNVGIIAPKTATLPKTWVTICNKLDHIIVPSEYCMRSAKASGVFTPILVCPPVIDSSFYTRTEPLGIADKLPSFKIVTTFSLTRSSNWVDTCLSYVGAFDRSDDVVLIVKGHEHNALEMVCSVLSGRKNVPVVYTIGAVVNEEVMRRLYSTADLFYLPAQGKAFGASYFQALSCGTPVVCADLGGHVEYMDPDYATFVRSVAYPSVPHPAEPYYDEALMWALPLNPGGTLKSSVGWIKEMGGGNRPSLPALLDEEIITQKLSLLVDELDESLPTHKKKLKVSIIVLSYNNYDMLSVALSTLARNTKFSDYEIIVVDNASDKTDTQLFEYLGSLSNCKVIYNDTNIGFGPGNNIGAQVARGEILLFLNNDTEPQPGWLTEIVKTFDNDPTVGIVGSKLLFPNMEVQHVGIAFKQTGDYYAVHPLIGKGWDDPLACITRDQLAVTGACLAIRKSVFKNVGGFDPAYEIGYYEDSDLCLKVREGGSKVVCNADSVVIHKCGNSFGKLGALRTLMFFRNNEDRFKAAWDSKLIDNRYMFASKQAYAPGRKYVAFLNSNMETYGGGEKEVVCGAKAVENDHNTTILMRLPNEVTRDDVKRNLGVDLMHTEVFTAVSGEPLRLIRDWDVFWNNEWNSTEAGAGKLNVLRVMFPQLYDDLTFLDSYDLILANSKYTAEWINQYWKKGADVLYPPVHMIMNPGEASSVARLKRDYILNVGRFFEGEHCKKHKVMIEAFQKLSGFDDWQLHLAGVVKNVPSDVAYYNSCVDFAGGDPRIIFHPGASFEDLSTLYKLSKIYWHATGYGETDPLAAEHFGITPVEAMSAGCCPILVGMGGLREIAKTAGVLTWETFDELIDLTKAAAKNVDVEKMVEAAATYSDDKFMARVVAIVNS